MKPCQNKLDILRRSPSRLVLSVLMASVWLGVGLLPAAAQQGEPVNLLSITPIPADSGEIAVTSPTNIDQAIDKALTVDDAEQGNKSKTNPMVIAEPADQAIDAPTEIPPAAPTEPALPADLTASQTAAQTCQSDGAMPVRRRQMMVWKQRMFIVVPKLAAGIFQMSDLRRLVLAIRVIASSTA